eukprot:1159325-Pelagomonas_calceolata.AAC.3
MLARIQDLLGPPSSSSGAAAGGGGGGGGRTRDPFPDVLDQGPKRHGGGAGPGGLTPVREVEEEEGEGEESLQAALNRWGAAHVCACVHACVRAHVCVAVCVN